MENGSKVMFKDFVWMKAHNKVFVGMRDLKGLMFQNVVQKQEEHCDTLCVMLKHSRLKARKMRFKEFVLGWRTVQRLCSKTWDEGSKVFEMEKDDVV